MDESDNIEIEEIEEEVDDAEDKDDAPFLHDNKDIGVGGGIPYKGLLQCVLQ